MRGVPFSEMNCSIARTLDVVGERWTLLVLRDAFRGVRRFEDFRSSLGIARNVLTDRLDTLVANGVLERRPVTEEARRMEYRLTQKGIDLFPVIIALMQWGDRYAAEEGRPIIVRHRECNHEVQAVLHCPTCDVPVTARETHSEPGPGATRRTEAHSA